MLTVVDRPVLQHVVDEAREAGIEHFIFVTGRNKAVIEDHFDIAYELEETLQKRGKLKEWQALKADLPAAGATSFTRQQVPLGLGHAVWCARDIVGDEPFAVLLPDMVTMPAGQGRCLAQCVAAYEKHGGNIIAVEEVSRACASTGCILSAHTSLATWPIYKFGTPAQHEQYLHDMASGRRLGAFALTEPAAGTDAGAGTCTAILSGDEYVLNGSKIFITNAPFAGVYFVFAKTDPAQGTRGMSAFIVEKDTCLAVAAHGALKWHYPRSGFGVQFREG